MFQISSSANQYLTETIGRQWSAFNGSIRTYYPNLSFEESDCFQHPMLTQNSIRSRYSPDEDDLMFCMKEVEKYVQKYVLTQRIDWEANGIEFYLIAHQRYLRSQRETSEQTKQELIESYETQLDQLQKQCDESLSIADSYAHDCEAVRNEAEYQRQKNGQLKAQIASLRYQIAQSKEIIPGIPVDGSYAEIGEWIQQYYPDRLTIHPRAIHSLKDAVYEDPQLVYKCLILLANEYYDYHTGIVDHDHFIAACKAVDPSLSESGAITDASAGMQGDEYFVQYQGQKRKLERHLTKGNSRDPKYCLRIYFFWDDQEQVTVIGNLPHHLDTTAT